ncbi:Putative short-chain fatty acid transporter (plasmid) [Sulfitobacter indolifex]|nr:TIGR00366 family protein [Sulfitobacter indolifex]UOA20555.1 Putative short-chain fatty acid transporter [Sulfitobacter indolifex]UOA20876.1 Putative short-chain fatty acid transporter [Sulfitobacter indolifex]
MNALANFFTRLIGRYLPDPLVIAFGLTFLTIGLAMVVEGAGFIQTATYWGESFWNLLAFSMQMTVILLAGYLLAKSPPVNAALVFFVSKVEKPATAVIVATLVGAIGSWLNWGFGLVIGTLVARELGQRVKGLHYPLVIAAAYSGFALYGIGLSGSVPLLIATEGHFLQADIGIVPISETILSPVLLITSLVIVLTLPLFNAWLHPKDPSKVIEAKPEAPSPAAAAAGDAVRSIADRMNNSPLPGIAIGLLGLVYAANHFVTGGSLNLNIINTIFLFLGILLFASPARYLAALGDGVTIVAGIIIQYPFYAGILGILTGSGLLVTFAQMFVNISTPETLPIWSFLSGGLINLLAPSGGGQWAVQGPVMMGAAKEIGASIPATALAVQIGDQWTNMIQPFWILPVLAISGLQLRDVMGYMVLILIYLGLIFGAAVMLWGFLGL